MAVSAVGPARVPWQRSLQEGHLIGKDAPVAENETLIAADGVGNIEQRHARFFWTPVALAGVARATGGNHIGPFVTPAPGYRDDVFDGQIRFIAVRATVGAHVAVTREQAVFAQAHVAAAIRAAMASADHDDRTADYERSFPGDFLQSAGHGEQALAQIVDDLAGGVVSGCTRERRPSHWLPLGVDDQDAGWDFVSAHLRILPLRNKFCMPHAVAVRAQPPASLKPVHPPSAEMAEREVELKLKLRVQDLATLRSRLDGLGASRTERIDSIYYDTPDMYLAACKAALRLRCIQQGRKRRWVQTFKTGDSEAALSVRGEWEGSAPQARIDPALLANSPLARMLEGDGSAQAMRGAKRLASLRPVFRTVFDRTTWELAVHGARIEAAVDLGEIQADGRSEPVREVELELRAGPQVAVLDLALELAGAVGRRRADLSLVPFGASKAARGYRLALGRAPTPFAAGHLSSEGAFAPKQGVAVTARRLVGHGMIALLANVAGLAESDDAEFVHQARIALRRMRAGLDLLGAAGVEMPSALRSGLRRWAARLGVARDWDVLRGQVLPSLAAAAPRAAGAKWERVCAAATKRVLRARARLRLQLDAPGFADFALRMLRWSATAPRKPGKRLEDFAAKAIGSQQRRLAKAGRSFSQLPADRQHKIRIQAKSLRYGIEMLHGSLPKRIRRAGLRALIRFQDALGSARDAAVADAAVVQLTRSQTIRRQARQWARAQQVRASAKAQRLAAELDRAR